MAMLKSVTKVNKDGVSFTSNVDAVEYLLIELTRGAMRDVGKFIVAEARKDVAKVTGKGRRGIQYKVNKKGRLRVGVREKGVKTVDSGFYMRFYELGTKNVPKVGMIANATERNPDMIRQIESQYLSAISDELKAAAAAADAIDESDEAFQEAEWETVGDD